MYTYWCYIFINIKGLIDFGFLVWHTRIQDRERKSSSLKRRTDQEEIEEFSWG